MLDEFKQEAQTFEVRFPQAFVLWDRSGTIWTRMRQSFPELNFQTAMPQQQIFESPSARAMTELETIRVSTRGPNADAELDSIAQALYDVTTEELGLRLFTRVGYRKQWSQSFATKNGAREAARIFVSSQFLDHRPPKLEAGQLNSSITFENEDIGLMVNARTEDRSTKVNVAWEYREKVKFEVSEEFAFVIDCDYFTKGSVDRDIFNPTAWVTQARRAMKKFWEHAL